MHQSSGLQSHYGTAQSPWQPPATPEGTLEVPELAQDQYGDLVLGWAQAMKGATTPWWNLPQPFWGSTAGNLGIPLAPYRANDLHPLVPL